MGSITLTLFFLLSMTLSPNAIHVKEVDGTRIISEKEDFELEKQLNRLRKPAVKTVKTTIGDIYDCVEITKQPAFDHPLLKDREIQMPPSSRRITKNENLITVDCPKGTVPIRRIEKEDLIRAESLLHESYTSNLTSITDVSPGRHFTVLMPKNPSRSAYWGIKATLSLHSLNVGPNQASFAQMWLERGDSIVQTGWTVNPKLYGDTRTRLFSFWKTKTRGCFNRVCGSGFVQVDQTVPIDVVFNNTSKYDERQYDVTLRIEFSEIIKSWWVVLKEGKNEDIYIGYWMQGSLPDLDKNGAYTYGWGGVATGPPNEPGPPMGNGHFNYIFLSRVAYMYDIKIIDSSKSWVKPGGLYDLQRYGENNNCYRLKWLGYDGGFGHYIFLYGGPGGKCK